MILTRRFEFRLDAERFVKTIDAEQFKTISQRYATEPRGDGWPKYLNLSKWMRLNIRRVRELDLDFGFRKRILDIGCGAGYFLYICKSLGHDVVGLDIDEVPMFAEMTRMLRLQRIIWRIEPYQVLPDLGRKFDLITAFMICFNGHRSPALWGRAEWTFFLDDLETRLVPGGRIHLWFNCEEDGNFFSEQLRRFFAERGAQIDGRSITFAHAPKNSFNSAKALTLLGPPQSRPNLSSAGRSRQFRRSPPAATNRINSATFPSASPTHCHSRIEKCAVQK